MKHPVTVLFSLLTTLNLGRSGGGGAGCLEKEECHFSYTDPCQWSGERWSVTRAEGTKGHRFNYYLTLDSGLLPGTLTSLDLCPFAPSSPRCLRFDFRFRHVRKLLPDSLTVSLRSERGAASRVVWNVSAINSKWHHAIVSIPGGAHAQIVLRGERYEAPWTSTVTLDDVIFQPHPCTSWPTSASPASRTESTSPRSPLPSSPAQPPSSIPSSTLSTASQSPQCSDKVACLQRNKGCHWEMSGRQWYLDYVMRNRSGKRRKVYSSYLRHNVTSGSVQSYWLCPAVAQNITARNASPSDLPSQHGLAGRVGCVWLWVFLQMGHRFSLSVQLLQEDGSCVSLLSVSLWTSQHRWRFVSLPVRAGSLHKIRITVERNEWSPSSVVAVDSIRYELKRHCPVVLPQADMDASSPPPPSACVTSSEGSERHVETAASSADENEEADLSQLIIRAAAIVLVVGGVIVLVTVTIWCVRRRSVQQKRPCDLHRAPHIEMNDLHNNVIALAENHCDVPGIPADVDKDHDVYSTIMEATTTAVTITDTIAVDTVCTAGTTTTTTTTAVVADIARDPDPRPAASPGYVNVPTADPLARAEAVTSAGHLAVPQTAEDRVRSGRQQGAGALCGATLGGVLPEPAPDHPTSLHKPVAEHTERAGQDEEEEEVEKEKEQEKKNHTQRAGIRERAKGKGRKEERGGRGGGGGGEGRKEAEKEEEREEEEEGGGREKDGGGKNEENNEEKENEPKEEREKQDKRVKETKERERKSRIEKAAEKANIKEDERVDDEHSHLSFQMGKTQAICSNNETNHTDYACDLVKTPSNIADHSLHNMNSLKGEAPENLSEKTLSIIVEETDLLNQSGEHHDQKEDGKTTSQSWNEAGHAYDRLDFDRKKECADVPCEQLKECGCAKGGAVGNETYSCLQTGTGDTYSQLQRDRQRHVVIDEVYSDIHVG